MTKSRTSSAHAACAQAIDCDASASQRNLPPHTAAAHRSVSRRFVAHSRMTLQQWLSRPIDRLELLAVLVDGIVLAGRCVVIALSIDRQGRKHILGLREGTTENATMVGDLLDDLIERGLDAKAPRLFVIDGSKALRRAIRARWAERALVQCCQVHKRRNVGEYLPEDERAAVRAAMQQAYELRDANEARVPLEELAVRLERTHPGAASSLREGLEETLTVQRLRIGGHLFPEGAASTSGINSAWDIPAYGVRKKQGPGSAPGLGWRSSDALGGR